MKKKKRSTPSHRRLLDLKKFSEPLRFKPLSSSWQNFVNIARMVQIALLAYFVIGTVRLFSSNKPISPISWFFCGIAILWIGHTLLKIFTSKKVVPYLSPPKKSRAGGFLDIFVIIIPLFTYILAIAASFVLMPHSWAIWIALIYPLLLILIILCSGGKLTINQNGNGNRDLSYPMMASLLPAFARGLFDFSLDQYAQTWYLILGISLGLVLLFIKSIQTVDLDGDDGDRYISFVSIWITFFLYSIGLVRISNCYFDTSTQEQKGYVVSKTTSESKKNRSYWIKIALNDKDGKTEKHSVDIETYDKAKPGDTIKVYAYNGALNAAWHEPSF